MQLAPVQWFDVTPFVVSGDQPTVHLRREPVNDGSKPWAGTTQRGSDSEYWVATGGFFGGEPAEFSLTRTGETVRVPMFAYKTQHMALPALFGLGVQIGLAAVADLLHHTRDQPKVAHLVIGHQCTDLRPAEEAFRCYIGIALQTR